MTVIERLLKRLKRLEADLGDPAADQAAEEESRVVILNHIRQCLESLGEQEAPAPENESLAQLANRAISLHFRALRAYCGRQDQMSAAGPPDSTTSPSP